MPNEFDRYVCTISGLAAMVVRDFGTLFKDFGFNVGERVCAGVQETAEHVSKKYLTGGRLFNKNQ